MYDDEDADLRVQTTDSGTTKIWLRRKKGEELGLITAPRGITRGIVVTDVKPGSASERLRCFFPGDLIMTINDRDVLNASHEAVKLALDVCPNEVTIAVSREMKSKLGKRFSSSGADGGATMSTNTDGPSSVVNPVYSEDTREGDEGGFVQGGRSHDGLFSEGLLANRNQITHPPEKPMERTLTDEGDGRTAKPFKKGDIARADPHRMSTLETDLSMFENPPRPEPTKKLGPESIKKKKKRTRTIKKEAGKLIIRLRQIVSNKPEGELPSFQSIKSALIEEFGVEQFSQQTSYIINFLKEEGMTEFEESSTDPTTHNHNIQRFDRAKSMNAKTMKKYLTMKQGRSASAWFKLVKADESTRVYAKMKGIKIDLFLSNREDLHSTIIITDSSSIQMHGYDLFVNNPGNLRWQLQAESEEVSRSWYKDLRATFVEICNVIDLDAIHNLGDALDGADKPKEEVKVAGASETKASDMFAAADASKENTPAGYILAMATPKTEDPATPATATAAEGTPNTPAAGGDGAEPEMVRLCYYLPIFILASASLVFLVLAVSGLSQKRRGRVTIFFSYFHRLTSSPWDVLEYAHARAC